MENNNEMAVVTTEELETEIIDEGNVIKLMKPLNGQKEVVMDFSKINGQVLINCEKIAKREDKNYLSMRLSTVFQVVVAAKVLGCRYDDILQMSGPDFMAVTDRVSGFLNGIYK